MNDDQQSRTAPDPLIEAVFKGFFCLALVLLAPALLLGLLCARSVGKLPPQQQRLVWSSVAILAVFCLAVGAHFFWPLTGPRHPFFILVVDAVRSLQKGAPWNGQRLFVEVLPVWGGFCIPPRNGALGFNQVSSSSAIERIG